MDIEKLIKEVDELHEQSEFIVSWFAKKYKKTIRRVGHLNKELSVIKLVLIKLRNFTKTGVY